MADALFQTKLPLATSAMVHQDDGTPVKQWFDFFQNLWQRTGGDNTNIDVLIGTLPGSVGSLIGRFNTVDGLVWVAFEATLANSVLVLSPGAIQLLSISQLLDVIGATQGDVLFRGAAGWQVLAPVVNGFFKSNGPGADPVYIPATANPASVADGITATGTVLADAFQLTAQWNFVTTTPVSTGVKLFDLGVGLEIRVWNKGANPLNVFPVLGGQIDLIALSTPYVLAAGKCQFFSERTVLNWDTAQLG